MELPPIRGKIVCIHATFQGRLMTIDEALCCPFCRNKAPMIWIASEQDLDNGPFWVECNCGKKGPSFQTTDEAITAWNVTPQARD